MVTELLQIWLDNDDDSDIQYSAEQYILLNDPDVVNVLNKCKEYYEPKRHLSQGELTKILEDIASGRISRKDYDFKNGEVVFLEPTFQERLTAIKMLRETADDDNTASTVQFVNNIIQLPNQPNQPNQSQPQLQPPNTNPLEDVPAGHYSLTLNPNPNIGEEA